MDSHTRALITGVIFVSLVVALELLQKRIAANADASPAAPVEMAADPGRG